MFLVREFQFRFLGNSKFRNHFLQFESDSDFHFHLCDFGLMFAEMVFCERSFFHQPAFQGEVSFFLRSLPDLVRGTYERKSFNRLVHFERKGKSRKCAQKHSDYSRLVYDFDFWIFSKQIFQKHSANLAKLFNGNRFY